QLRPDGVRNRRIGIGLLPLGLDRDDWRAPVREFANARIERNLTQKAHAEPLRLVGGTPMAERLGPAAAMRARQIAHVLDDPENGDVDLVEHGDTAPG